MEILQKQYAELLAGQQFREEDLDPAVLARHIAALSSSVLLTGCAVSIFDLHRGGHVYESEFHRALFSDPQQEYAGVRIHPEDLVQVARNGVAGMRHGPSKEIADELHISIHTVNTHRQRILAKLGVDNSLEAVKYAWILGILDA